MDIQANSNIVNKTSSALQNRSSSAASDLWESVRTIIELQNQAPELKPFPRNQHIPLSFNQERLWLLNQLKPNSSSYNIPFAFHISGELCIDFLEKSIQILLQRHESLRTTFTLDVSNKAIQVINNLPDEVLQFIDLTSQSSSDSEEKATKLIRQEAQSSFDLSKGPLFRVKLLKISDLEYILLINVHHIVFDGWSEGVLFREISTLYGALCAQEAPQLGLLSIQYADFAAWQRDWLQSDFRQALLNYWSRNLKDQPQELALPINYSRSVDEPKRSSYEAFQISKELTSSLKKLARQERATLFPTLLAAFKVLIYCYTEQSDILVCTPTANRNRSDLKGLIGYFVNLLVLRTDLSERPSFSELIKRVKQSVSGASAHQDLPVQELATCLEKTQAPLSQILFALQNTPQTSLTLYGLKVRKIDIDNGMADFDLFLSLTEESGIINGVLKYNSNLFKKDTIELLLQRYEHILKAVIANPKSSIDELLPLTSEEYKELAAMRANNKATVLQTQTIQQQYLAPRNKLEEQLVSIWQDVLNLKRIGVRDNFFELGGKSLLAVEVFARIEAAFGQNLPLATLLQASTVEDLAKVLCQEEEPVPFSPLVLLKSGDSRPPFFCVHGKGGNILNLRAMANLLEPEQPVYGLQSRALDGQSSLATCVEDIAADYIQEIKTVQPKGPYFLGGYSFGGTVAFEMAQQLCQQGHKVGFLVFIDSFCPTQPSEKLRYDIVNILHLRVHPLSYLKYLLVWMCDKFSKKGKMIEKADFQSSVDNIVYQVNKANLRAFETYTPKHYSGDLTILRATDRMDTQQNVYRDPKLGWGELVEGKIEAYSISTFHDTMFNEPHVRTVAKILEGCLNEAYEAFRNQCETVRSE